MTVRIPSTATSARRRGPRWSLAALALAGSLAFAACSTTGASMAPSAEASEAAVSVQDLAVAGKEFAFELPASIPAGLTKITLTNDGQEEHQAQAALMAEGSPTST